MIFQLLLFPVKTFQLLRGAWGGGGEGERREGEKEKKKIFVQTISGPRCKWAASVDSGKICLIHNVAALRLSATAAKRRGAIARPAHQPTQSLSLSYSLFPPQTSASRLSREQARVRALWRQAASLRGAVTHLRTFTDR